jgi:hypothetical protein
MDYHCLKRKKMGMVAFASQVFRCFCRDSAAAILIFQHQRRFPTCHMYDNLVVGFVNQGC